MPHPRGRSQALQNKQRGVRICLAASGGGHVRQLLDLEPVWGAHDHFFVTEETSLGRSIAEKHRTHFVDHFALGQAKLGHPLEMAKSGWRNLRQSIRAIRAERPDIVISTGAGAVLFSCLAARATGAPFISVDSFARFDKPSAFARMAKPFATSVVVQSAALKAVWPDALLFDPLKILDTPPPPKEDLMFVTVGATLGFERMIETVAQLKRTGAIPERIVFQTGSGPFPTGLGGDVEMVREMPFDAVQALLQRARIVVTHGGTGSLITALRAGCNVVAMPREFARREHYDDHQSEITEAFEARGLILAAHNETEMAAALQTARHRTPTLATTDPSELRAFLSAEIEKVAARQA